MITLYGFGRIFPEGHGETKDMWAQWPAGRRTNTERWCAISPRSAAAGFEGQKACRYYASGLADE